MQYLARSCNLLKQILFYVLYSSEENSLNDYFSDNPIIKKTLKMIFFFIFGYIRVDRRTGVAL